MTTKPKPGEQMRDYLERCCAESLRRAGASETEVHDFADVLVIECNDPRNLTPSDAKCYLDRWRIDCAEQATITREHRAARIAAGYTINTPAVESPVYLNGVTPW